MTFNTVTYVVFLLLTVSLYWILPLRPRLWMLLGASVVFYGFWRMEYVPLMLFSAFFNYGAGVLIGRSTYRPEQKTLLYGSLAINICLLGYFKYAAFVVGNASSVLNLFGLHVKLEGLDILLPLGISFYTFHSMSYIIDVYRGFIKAERSFVMMANYVTFFPQLVAGPILRAAEVMPQLARRPKFQVSNACLGGKRIVLGLFLKVVLADNIAPLVDSGFAQSVHTLAALDVWTLAFLFGFQIYFDFSAYSHIAIGSALLMGIRFPENFNFPYLACSPRDFWRRWHISLSSWVRDYLYLPLAGVPVRDSSLGGLEIAANGLGKKSKTFALFVSWALMGLWHGASWTFVIWGVYHSTLVFSARLKIRLLESLHPTVCGYLGWMVTLPLVMLGWVFFRARDLSSALAMMYTVLQPSKYGTLELRETTYVVAAALMIGIVLVYFIHAWYRATDKAHSVTWIVGESTVLAGVTAGVFIYLRPISQFIYFQF